MAICPCTCAQYLCDCFRRKRSFLSKKPQKPLSEHAGVVLTSLFLYGHLISRKPYGSFGERGSYTHLSGDAPRNGWVSLTRNPLFETVTLHYHSSSLLLLPFPFPRRWLVCAQDLEDTISASPNPQAWNWWEPCQNLMRLSDVFVFCTILCTDSVHVYYSPLSFSHPLTVSVSWWAPPPAVGYLPPALCTDWSVSHPLGQRLQVLAQESRSLTDVRNVERVVGAVLCRCIGLGSKSSIDSCFLFWGPKWCLLHCTLPIQRLDFFVFLGCFHWHRKDVTGSGCWSSSFSEASLVLHCEGLMNWCPFSPTNYCWNMDTTCRKYVRKCRGTLWLIFCCYFSPSK